MEDASIVFITELDNKKLQKQLQKLKSDIGKLENSISGQEAKKSLWVKQAEELRQNLKAARAEAKRYEEAWRAGKSGADKDQAAAIARVQQLESRYAKAEAEINKIDAKLIPAYKSLDAMKDEAGGLERELAQTGVDTEKMSSATKKANKSMGKFALRMKEVMRSALVFTLISQGLAKLREWTWKVIRSNTEATAAVAKLKGALLTLAQPLVDIIIPAFTAFVNILAKVVAAIASFISAIFGKTAEQSADAAESLNKETEAISGVGNAAKKAEKQLASFDEINRLTSQDSDTGGGNGVSGSIAPDFSAIPDLPQWLKSLTADIALKIKELKFAWDDGTIAKSKDAWITVLSGMLGAVIGSIFGGLSGGVIGLVLGLLIGLASCTFLDKTKAPEKYKELFVIVLSAILGAILGARFAGLSGGVIGLLLGVAISIVSIEFMKGYFGNWDPSDTWFVVITAILGAVIGSYFGGLTGGIIGLILGASISITALNFLNGLKDGGREKAMFKIVLTAILGLIIGTAFGGFIGGVIGLMVGLTIGWTSVMFDESIAASVKSAATKVVRVSLTTIIGALIGAAFGGGIFGGIVGGVIGLTFGLAINIKDAKINDNYTKRGPGSGGSFSRRSSTSSNSIASQIAAMPAKMAPVPMATGGVIPPNREFLALYGDQRHGNNIEAPEGLIRKIVREESGGMNAKLLQAILDAIKAGAVVMIDRDQVGRVIYDTYNSESSRHGVKLTTR